MLQEALQSGGEIHAALFELNDPQLIAALQAFGSRAHVVLANGDSNDDENLNARNVLRGSQVDVRDRLVSTSSHFAHNKFLVVSDASGPRAVWTGSTNWAPTGLCTQVNNGLLIEDPDVARVYLDQWHALIGDPTYADAVLDRLVHNAHRLNLSGDSLRKKRATATASAKIVLCRKNFVILISGECYYGLFTGPSTFAGGLCSSAKPACAAAMPLRVSSVSPVNCIRRL